MKYIDEFRDKRLIVKIAAKIRRISGKGRPFTIMEVCGTHTMAIMRFGLRDILPANIKLISGPGCPVCVTPNGFLDKAIELAGMKDVIVTTFGDMMKVPGSYSSLEKEKARGANIRIVYSATDALDIARRNPDKEVVFLGIGFETTAPTVAASMMAAKKEGIGNFSVLCGHKTMPEALKALVSDKALSVDGFILPGHVSVIIGSGAYDFLGRKHKKRCVVAGFEPLDILEAIYMLVSPAKQAVGVEYTRLISRNGNRIAQKAMERVFEKASSNWRGIGSIKGSGLRIRSAFSAFDADKKFRVKAKPVKENKACICGDVLKGLKTPPDCGLFAKACTPAHPVGACMVSSEGACAAWFRYKGKTNG